MAMSPMMQQYHQAKEACGDALLFFRMGDFYELFHEDAKTASRILGLTLTSREKGENPVPMAGFPHHQLEQYLVKIIHAGFRAAICDQVENPKKAKGLVKREVTRIVTRGTLTEDALLDANTSNYLAAIVGENPTGIAWVDLSTGRFEACTVEKDRVESLLAQIAPSECLVQESTKASADFENQEVSLTPRPEWAFASDAAQQVLTKHFGTRSLEGFGFDMAGSDKPAIRAAGAILDYLSETQKTSLAHIDRLIPYRPAAALQIDPATRRSLELTRTMHAGRREGSLLGIIDRSSTAMGARMLASWLAAPLTDLPAIDARLDAVSELRNDGSLLDSLRETLRTVYDIERLLARVSTGRATPRDLGQVAKTLATLPALKAKVTGRKSGLLQALETAIELLPDVRAILEKALEDECPLTIRDGGMIRPGYDTKLDELRDLTAGGKQWIAKYQADEMKRTGIPNIKVGFNRVFGYYLEVTHAHVDKVPTEYIRKQTIKAAERYITPELKTYEEKVLVAEDAAKELELELFLALRNTVAAAGTRLLQTAQAIAQLDVLVGLAMLARERNYCRPTMVETPMLALEAARHPVLDILEPDGTFIPNDTSLRLPADFKQPISGLPWPVSEGDESTDSLDTFSPSDSIGVDIESVAIAERECEGPCIAIITGPNMAGKSTYIRQVALIAIMAQMGSHVPAKSATIGIADRVFARVGASDELSRGQSTFMVEMTETARILNTATKQSLVILDEIGRGTSTYDGVSLAWSIVEYLHDRLQCRTLFATHYHELTELAKTLPSVCNLNVAVREWNDEVVFLHQIVPGSADKSYGIHVARLAGVPKQVNERAKDILAQLEAEQPDVGGHSKISVNNAPTGELQLTLFGPTEHPLLETIRATNLEETTPMQALFLLEEWKRELAEEHRRHPR